MSNSDNNEIEQPKRKRSLTDLTLGWLREKLCRSEEIKESLKSGAYEVDTHKIAESLVNK